MSNFNNLSAIENNIDVCEIVDASKNNRVPSLAFEKIFEVKYSECYGDKHNIDELKSLAIFDILAYEILTEKQLKDIQKNVSKLNNLSLEEIDARRNESIMRNKRYIEPEYHLVNYYFLKNNKLNIIYKYKDEYDAFIMKTNNHSIEDSINEYINKIDKFKEEHSNNMPIPKEWFVRIDLLKQILKKEENKK